MNTTRITPDASLLAIRLRDAEATITALLSGEIDAVVDPGSNSPVLLQIAQTALRGSESRYRSIVETANEGIWTIDFDATITYVNQRLADMLGYAVHEIVGQSIYTFLPSEFHEAAALRLERATLGVPEESEGAILQRGGAHTWVLVKSSSVRDGTGSPVGMLVMMTDWSRHRDAERALKKSEAEYRQMVESTSDGIVKIDRDNIITFANGRFADMIGYSPSELIGTSLLEIVAESEHARVQSSLHSRSRGATDTTDTVYLHKSGREISVNIAGSALHDEQGEFSGILGVVRDVTERKKLQAQLIVSDRMASVGTLAAGVAHEINNPLAAVVANLEYIDEGLTQFYSRVGLGHDPGWVRAHLTEPLADAREAADRVRFIVRDLMIFSRSPADQPSLAVNVNSVLESSLRMGWNEIRHRADLVKDLGDVPFVMVNEARLGQVFLNLIVNAAQSLPVGHLGEHQIRVRTFHVDDRVVIEIGDTGSGIPPEIIERIFDAFYTTKEVGLGTGLGLAICQRIVTDMGGSLTVTSTVGLGSVFRVSIPVATEERIDLPVTVKKPAIGPSARILVIDDDELVARGVQRSLGDAYEILSASSAWAVLALVEAGQRFDIILCDLMMPNMTGMELHQALTAYAPDQAERMLFITGGAFTNDARQFITSRDTIFIEKPFSLDSLRAGVSEFLSERTGKS